MADLIDRDAQTTQTNTPNALETLDCVSRQKAIEAIGRVILFNEFLRAEEAIKNLPTAQPERKKGKWIYNSPVTMKCNQCGLVIKDWDWHRFKFCPNCDCDMRGEQE